MSEATALSTVLLLFRKDLRLDDNPALLAALQAAKSVIPVFVWSPEEEGQFQPGRCSKWWWRQSVIGLSQQITSLGSRLILRRAKDSCKAVLQLVHETQAKAVFMNHLYDPISLVKDHTLKQQLTDAGILCRTFGACLLFEPWDVLDSIGQPFTTFSDFWTQLQAMPQQPPFPSPPPAALPPVHPKLVSQAIHDLDFFANKEQEEASRQLESKWVPGAAGGLARLEAFLTCQLPHFSAAKARVDASITSRLSPWIHVGSLSVRFIYYRVRAKQAEWLVAGDDQSESCQHFLRQLAYREYSRYLSFHFPFMHERPLLSHLRCVPWNLDQIAFKAWKMGMTGYPLVDAAMKELWSSGWMHNRLRVVCGVFAVKHLLLPWQWGLKHYWDALLDADIESDALGWQYLSGCMIDAPHFGDMMDIIAEANVFDPDGEFVRRWLPVLARLPTAYVHAPWTASQQILDAADVELGFNYPYPIVTQEEASERLASAAALIQLSLDTGQDQQVSGNDSPQLQGSGNSRQPYRPATAPAHSQSQGHLPSGAAAAAADLQHTRVLQRQQQALAAGAVNGAAANPAAVLASGQLHIPSTMVPGTGRHVADEMYHLNEQWETFVGADAEDSGSGIVGGPNAVNVEAAVDGPVVQEQQQQETQQQIQQWASIPPAAAYAAAAAQPPVVHSAVGQKDLHLQQRRQWRQQWQRQQRFCRTDHDRDRRYAPMHHRKLLACDKYDNMSGADDDYSEDSEVNSNAPLISEACPTACSGIAVQQDRQQDAMPGAARGRTPNSLRSGSPAAFGHAGAQHAQAGQLQGFNRALQAAAAAANVEQSRQQRQLREQITLQQQEQKLRQHGLHQQSSWHQSLQQPLQQRQQGLQLPEQLQQVLLQGVVSDQPPQQQGPGYESQYDEDELHIVPDVT